MIIKLNIHRITNVIFSASQIPADIKNVKTIIWNCVLIPLKLIAQIDPERPISGPISLFYYVWVKITSAK